MLAREDQHRVLEERGADGFPFRRVERGEIDAGDDGADGCERGFDSRLHGRIPESCASAVTVGSIS